MHHLLTTALAAAAIAATATAQLSHTLPNGFATTAGNTNNAFPWGTGVASWPGLRTQCIYDGVEFTSASITYPIRILGVKWRSASGSGTWTGTTFNSAVVNMCTSPSIAANVQANFATQQGADWTQVFSGPVTSLAGTGPLQPVVDLTLQSPFLYDPNLGPLVIDVDLTGGTTGGSHPQLDVHGTMTGSRVWASTLYPAPNGAWTNHAVVVELSYVPAQGLFAGFSANVTNGNSPLNVQFTDSSFTSDPGGITAWLWDLDGDNVIDSAVQNPTFTYGCGSYTVSLQVFDNAHPSNTLTRANYINTDPLAVSFTSSVITGSTYQFTDTSTPTPQAWLWDLDGDNVTDSVLQNPTFTYPANCTTYNVTLTAILNCRIVSASRSIAIAPATATAVPFSGGNGTSAATVGNLFDLQVTAPEGITVCAIEQGVYTYVGPFTANIYVTENTYVGKNANAAAWRLVGTGNGVSAGGPFTPAVPYYVPLNTSFYLPAGNYGMAVFLTQPAGAMNITYTNGPQGPFVNTDVTFFPVGGGGGESQVGLFAGTAFTPRCWNGSLHYTKTSISQTAGFGYMNSGCASSLGVSNLTITGQPKIGQNSTININNMPFSAGILAIGFSRTTSVFGPLPVNLTTFGLPGCTLYISPDVLIPVVGASNMASFTTIVPNSPSVIGTLFYGQALVNDPAANTFGGVASDAACGIVGQ